MARPLRIEYPGAWYHFTCRGNVRSSIFNDNLDRKEFLNILSSSLEKYRVKLHGYVLMNNHFHLLLHTPLGNLTNFAQRFNTTYTVYFNRRHKRAGHLYQGRYKAILVQKESYLLELIRYVHLNPVKIHKIKKLGISAQLENLRNYIWSSHLGYIFLKHRYDFVSYNNLLNDFGGDNSKGRKRYREFVEEGLLKGFPSPFKEIKGQVVLGDSKFTDWLYEKVMKGKKPDPFEQSLSKTLLKETKPGQIEKVVCQVFKIDKRLLLKKRSGVKEARMILIDLCCRYRIFHKSLKEIGEELGGLTVGGMSQVRKRLKVILNYDLSVKRKFNKCVKIIECQ